MGKSAVAIGKSKQEARALAAEKVLSELLPKKETSSARKNGKRVAKPAAKKPASQTKRTSKRISKPKKKS